jgi:hypothetical protein
MRVRVGLIVVIYEKALRLSNSERSRSTGDIVNLQSVDATKLQDLCTYALMAISGPIQVLTDRLATLATTDAHIRSLLPLSHSMNFWAGQPL